MSRGSVQFKTVFPKSSFLSIWHAHQRSKGAESRLQTWHWSVPQLRAELLDSYAIVLSEDAIEDYLERYQCMLAACQQDPVLLKKAYQKTRRLMLSIDGLQPEKGHETLYVVRELSQHRVWFAEALLSSATSEIRPLLVRAHDWAKSLEPPGAFVDVGQVRRVRDNDCPRVCWRPASLLRQPFFA